MEHVLIFLGKLEALLSSQEAFHLLQRVNDYLPCVNGLFVYVSTCRNNYNY